MTKRLLISSALLLFVSLVAVGQEKPSPSTKPQPVVVAPADSLPTAAAQESATKSPQTLPKFELQQFVITGSASIDLPDVEKIGSDEPMSAPELSNPLDAPRDRSTVDFRSEQKEMFVQESGVMKSGRLQGSVGTFLSSRFGIWLSRRDIDNYIFGDLQYGSSRAYVPFANKSEGHISLTAGLTLNGPSEWYDRGMLKGDLGYGSKTYRFFGSSSPSVSRTASQFELSAGYNSSVELVSQYSGQAGIFVAGISDSSSSVTETRFNVGLGYEFLMGSVPIDGRLGLSLVSTTGSGEGTLPMFDGGLKTHKLWFGDFFLQGAGQFFITQGMLGQKLSRLYPQIEIGYRLLETTVASIAYTGRVQFNSLTGLLQAHPYLAATATIRQSDVPIDLLALVETGWSESLRTRVSARYQSIRDYPLFTEGGRKGFWTTAYFGTTELSTIQADLFAKFAANSYFTLSLAANSSKNSVTNWKIPYIPDVQFDAGASLEVLPLLRLFPTLSVVDRRIPDLYATQRMKAYVVLGIRGEYSVMRSLDVFVDFRNLTNSNYDEWNGYRATPFVASAGMSVRW
jgi:hypothetical protein